METVRKSEPGAGNPGHAATERAAQSELPLLHLDYITAAEPCNTLRAGELLPIRFFAEKWWAEFCERASNGKQ